MRRIDAWIGRPLTAMLGWFTRRPESLHGDFQPGRLPERVICAKFVGLGSVVMVLPLLQALKSSGVRVALWSFEGQADLIRLSGLADEVWVVKTNPREFLGSLWRSWCQARRFKADAFLDLETCGNFGAILARASGARVRLGYLSRQLRRDRLYTHLVSAKSGRHLIEANLVFAERLGIPSVAQSPAALPKLPNIEHVKNILPGLSGRIRILVNINTNDQNWQRTWSEDHWVTLCNRLLEDHRVDLVFPGTEEEFSDIQGVIARLKDPVRVHNFAGKAYLVELLRLLEDADLAISVDNGMLHLAAWAGTPLVGLFGPGTATLTGPRSEHARVVQAGISCSPCLGASLAETTHCRANACMQAIAPERVYRVCLDLLQKSKSARLRKAA